MAGRELHAALVDSFFGVETAVLMSWGEGSFPSRFASRPRIGRYFLCKSSAALSGQHFCRTWWSQCPRPPRVCTTGTNTSSQSSGSFARSFASTRADQISTSSAHSGEHSTTTGCTSAGWALCSCCKQRSRYSRSKCRLRAAVEQRLVHISSVVIGPLLPPLPAAKPLGAPQGTSWPSATLPSGWRRCSFPCSPGTRGAAALPETGPCPQGQRVRMPRS